MRFKRLRRWMFHRGVLAFEKNTGENVSLFVLASLMVAMVGGFLSSLLLWGLGALFGVSLLPFAFLVAAVLGFLTVSYSIISGINLGSMNETVGEAYKNFISFSKLKNNPLLSDGELQTLAGSLEVSLFEMVCEIKVLNERIKKGSKSEVRSIEDVFDAMRLKCQVFATSLHETKALLEEREAAAALVEELVSYDSSDFKSFEGFVQVENVLKDVRSMKEAAAAERKSLEKAAGGLKLS